MPELKYVVSGDESGFKKSLKEVEAQSAKTSAKVQKDFDNARKASAKSTDGIMSDAKKLQQKGIKLDIATGDVSNNNSGSAVNATNAKRAAEANAAYAASSRKVAEAKVEEAVATKAVTTAQTAQITASRTLQTRLESYRAIAEKATDPDLLARYNKKIEETQAEITRLGNVGRTGFDSMGNAIKKNTGLLSGLWSSVKGLVALIPGIGLATALAFLIEPITKWIFELSAAEKAVKAFTRSRQEMLNLQAKEIAETQIYIDKLKNTNVPLEQRQRLMDEFILKSPNVLSALSLQNIAQKEGQEILDSYLVSLRKKIQLQQLEKDYTESMQREADLKSGKLSDETDLSTLQKGMLYTGAVISPMIDVDAITSLTTSIVPKIKKNLGDLKDEINGINMVRRSESAKTQKAITKGFEDQIKAVYEGTSKLKSADDSSLAALEAKYKVNQERLEGLQEGQDASALRLERARLKAAIKARKELLGLDKDVKVKSDPSINQAANLQVQVDQLLNKYKRNALTPDKEAQQAINDEFKSIADKVKRFNADPKHKVKIVETNLEEARKRAIDTLVYEQDTARLGKSLEEQKALYQRYEQYKEEFGVKAANARFGTETNYLDRLEKEYATTFAQGLAGGFNGVVQQRLKMLDVERREAVLAREKTNNDLLKRFMTYAEKRKLIEEQTSTTVAALIAKGEVLKSDVARSEGNKRIDALDEEHADEMNSYKFLFENIGKLSREQTATAIEEFRIQARGAGLPLSAIDKLIEKYRKLDAAASTKNRTQELRDILEDLSRVASEFAQINGSVAGIASTLINSAKAYIQISKSLEELRSDDAKPEAKVAAGVGIAGAALAVVNSVVGYFKGLKQAKEEARKTLQEFQTSAVKGELEYQALLRKRDQDQVARGKSTYRSIIAQLDLLKSQSPKIQGAFDKVYASLQGQSSVEGVGYKHGTWLRKAKTWDIMASLAGTDYARLEQLYSQGKLKDQAKADFESLRALKEELQAAGLEVEELQGQLNELLTGTTITGLADGLSQLFENGKFAAEDFATSFEEIMRKAIVNSFRLKVMEDAMTPLYNEFAALFASGTPTEDQIAALKEKYKVLGAQLGQQFKDLETITGQDLMTKQDPEANTKNALAGAISGASQESINLLAGQMGGQRVALVELVSLNKTGVSLQQQCVEFSVQKIGILNRIEANTFRTANNTERLSGIETALVSIDRKIINGAALAANGIGG